MEPEESCMWELDEEDDEPIAVIGGLFAHLDAKRVCPLEKMGVYGVVEDSPGTNSMYHIIRESHHSPLSYHHKPCGVLTCTSPVQDCPKGVQRSPHDEPL